MAFPVHRFQNLKTHTFDVEVVTPLFLSGSIQGRLGYKKEISQTINRILSGRHCIFKTHR